jgi:hydrogen cyanide synthase HcnC
MGTLIVGGGVVGLSLAYGLLNAGEEVTVIDGADDDYRTSRGNFGLVWVSGKGGKCVDYSRWTRRSAELWPDFARELLSVTGVNVRLIQDGGIEFCTSGEQLKGHIELLTSLKEASGGDYPFEILDRGALKALVPEIGPDVIGGTYCPMDGHVNPLLLLRALSSAVRRKGGAVHIGVPVMDVIGGYNRFTAVLADGTWHTDERLVLCAGLGAIELGPKLGFKAPVRPQQGQIIITEKLPEVLKYPSLKVRQVNEGGMQIGASKAEIGFDDSEDIQTLAKLARDAIQILPDLAKAKVVRSWGSLRIMTPDGLPIYQRSREFPGASFVTCHSGVTLAAVHAGAVPDWVLNKGHAPDLSSFDESRFNV